MNSPIITVAHQSEPSCQPERLCDVGEPLTGTELERAILRGKELVERFAAKGDLLHAVEAINVTRALVAKRGYL